jgi:hypothetical protein
MIRMSEQFTISRSRKHPGTHCVLYRMCERSSELEEVAAQSKDADLE